MSNTCAMFGILERDIKWMYIFNERNDIKKSCDYMWETHTLCFFFWISFHQRKEISSHHINSRANANEIQWNNSSPKHFIRPMKSIERVYLACGDTTLYFIVFSPALHSIRIVCMCVASVLHTFASHNVHREWGGAISVCFYICRFCFLAYSLYIVRAVQMV